MLLTQLSPQLLDRLIVVMTKFTHQDLSFLNLGDTFGVTMCNTRERRLASDEDVQFALILWYVAKMVSTLWESSLCSSGIYLRCFPGDINVVHLIKGGFY